MKAALALIALGCCVACQAKPQTLLTVRERNQAQLDHIADKCGLPRNTFRLVGDDEVQIQPAADADYRRVECALSEFPKGKGAMKLGFVGNEYYVGNEQ